MAGYNGYSMSNNAVQAYNDGEKPMSKWTKTAILEALKGIGTSKLALLRKVDAATLKRRFLVRTSYHHTSSRYNKTDFYTVNVCAAEELTVQDIQALTAGTQKNDAPQKVEYTGNIEYIEWEGTRKHPKAIKQELRDVIIEERGCFYIVKNESGREILRKKIGSNGTYVTKA